MKPTKPPKRIRKRTNLTLDPHLLALASEHCGLGKSYRSISHLVEEAMKEKLSETSPNQANEGPGKYGKPHPPLAPPLRRKTA